MEGVRIYGVALLAFWYETNLARWNIRCDGRSDKRWRGKGKGSGGVCLTVESGKRFGAQLNSVAASGQMRATLLSLPRRGVVFAA